MSSEGDNDEDEDLDKLERQEGNEDDEEEDDEENNLETSDETDDPTKPVTVEKEKRKRMLRLKRLKRKTKARAYQFTGGTDVVGIVFLEIGKITDLPPERNRELLKYVFGEVTNISSHTDIIRYGSVCSGVSWAKDVPNSGYSSQFEPNI